MASSSPRTAELKPQTRGPPATVARLVRDQRRVVSGCPGKRLCESKILKLLNCFMARQYPGRTSGILMRIQLPRRLRPRPAGLGGTWRTGSSWATSPAREGEHKGGRPRPGRGRLYRMRRQPQRCDFAKATRNGLWRRSRGSSCGKSPHCSIAEVRVSPLFLRLRRRSTARSLIAACRDLHRVGTDPLQQRVQCRCRAAAQPGDGVRHRWRLSCADLAVHQAVLLE